MKKALFGAGGFAREISNAMGFSDIVFFVNDEYQDPNKNIISINKFDPSEHMLLIAVADPLTRNKIVETLPIETKYYSFIDKNAVIMDSKVTIGEGSIICAGSIITTNITIGKHSHLNKQTIIGHDSKINDYFTTAPGAKVSGNCTIGKRVYLGANATVKEKLSICDDVVVGLNGGVVKDITEKGTYVGTPAKKI